MHRYIDISYIICVCMHINIYVLGLRLRADALPAARSIHLSSFITLLDHAPQRTHRQFQHAQPGVTRLSKTCLSKCRKGWAFWDTVAHLWWPRSCPCVFRRVKDHHTLLRYPPRGQGTSWRFWEDTSRFTGVPKKSLCQKTWKLQCPHKCWPHLSL